MEDNQKSGNSNKPPKTGYSRGIAIAIGKPEKEIVESEPVKNYEKAHIEGRVGRPRKTDKKS